MDVIRANRMITSIDVAESGADVGATIVNAVAGHCLALRADALPALAVYPSLQQLDLSSAVVDDAPKRDALCKILSADTFRAQLQVLTINIGPAEPLDMQPIASALSQLKVSC